MGDTNSIDVEKCVLQNDAGASDSRVSSFGGGPPPLPNSSTSSSLVRLLRYATWSSRGTARASNSKSVWSKFRPWKTPSPRGSVAVERNHQRQPFVRQLQACPDGYPRLAAFLDSDDNFMLYRRFGYLQARLLLEKQNRLRLLEEELEVLDDQANQSGSRELSTQDDIESESAKERRDLMQKIEHAFHEYASLLQVAQTLTQCNRPSSGEYSSVENFLYNREPLAPSEQGFIYHKEDLITLRPGREHAWLDSSVERFLKWLKCDFIRDLFCSKETKQKTDGIEVYYTRERIERFVIAIIVSMILVLLVIPVYLLYHLTQGVETGRSNAICMGVLLISTLLFSACISLFTRAKRHEILAAAAAYCAVLVVFLGNVGNTGHQNLVGSATAFISGS